MYHFQHYITTLKRPDVEGKTNVHREQLGSEVAENVWHANLHHVRRPAHATGRVSRLCDRRGLVEDRREEVATLLADEGLRVCVDGINEI